MLVMSGRAWLACWALRVRRSWRSICKLGRSIPGVLRAIAALGTRWSAMSIGRKLPVRMSWYEMICVVMFSDRVTGHKHCLQPGCEFDGSNEAALNQHIQKDHFPCEGCKLILPSSTKLKLHQETCPLILTCSHCGEKYAGKVQSGVHPEHSCLEEKRNLGAVSSCQLGSKLKLLIH